MQVNVLYFSLIRDRAGTRSEVLELPQGTSVADLKRKLVELHPNLERSLQVSVVAVNREFAFDEDELHAGDDVAVFPPVSGGGAADDQTLVHIIEDEIIPEEWTRPLVRAHIGAVCAFTGYVRATTGGGALPQTEQLTYEVYLPMAEAKMRQIAVEIRTRWPEVAGISIVQRVGTFVPGTMTVLVACSAGHRNTGVFEAANYGIDRLKQIVPIWKREVGPEGEIWIEGDYIPGRDDCA